MKQEVVCPKCHSNQISSNKKGFSTGDILIKGLIFGASDANKIIITCLLCGTKFYPGYGDIRMTKDDGSVSYKSLIAPVKYQSRSNSIYYILIAILLLAVVIIVGKYLTKNELH